MLNPDLIEQLAGAIGTEAGLIEKDWYVTRALGVLASIQHELIQPIFSGGTSLSKGWGLIKRFSEDIDFKVIGNVERRVRRTYREQSLPPCKILALSCRVNLSSETAAIFSL